MRRKKGESVAGWWKRERIELHKVLRDCCHTEPNKRGLSMPEIRISELTPSGEVPIITLTENTTNEEIIISNQNRKEKK